MAAGHPIVFPRLRLLLCPYWVPVGKCVNGRISVDISVPHTLSVHSRMSPIPSELFAEEEDEFLVVWVCLSLQLRDPRALGHQEIRLFGELLFLIIIF